MQNMNSTINLLRGWMFVAVPVGRPFRETVANHLAKAHTSQMNISSSSSPDAAALSRLQQYEQPNAATTVHLSPEILSQ